MQIKKLSRFLIGLMIGSTGLLIGIGVHACKTVDKKTSLKADPNAAGLSADEVAQAMKILGAKEPNGQQFCGGACHGGTNWHSVTKSEVLGQWLPNTKEMHGCFEAASSPQQKVDCFRKRGQFTSESLKSLAFYRAGARHSYFKNMFTEAFGADSQEYKDFLSGKGSAPSAIMPVPASDLTGASLSEEQFNQVLKVFLHPEAEAGITAFFGERNTIDESCTANISPELKQHMKEMQTGGWQSELTATPDQRRTFFGCRYSRTDFDPLKSPIESCFTGADRDQVNFDFPWAENWDTVVDPTDGKTIKQGIRVLSDLHGCQTTYWMRSSADGRFVGNGTHGCPDDSLPPEAQGFFIDLKTNKKIAVDAPYDPGFCPDNSCFTFIAGRAVFCRQEMLMEDASGRQPTFLGLTAPENARYCTQSEMGVYQHIGAALDGSRYIIVRTDNYSNDDGGTESNRSDPSVDPFSEADQHMEMYKMCKENKCGTGLNAGIPPPNGTPFALADVIQIKTPFEGDFGISPSSRLLTSRIARKDAQGQVGYRLRKYDVDSGAPTTRELGTICMRGGKASMSFDERFVVTHHYTDDKDFDDLNKSRRGADKYTDSNDPRFRALIRASANIWMTDLWTGKSFRLTTMNPEQFALYPHFRADGWLYFLVRDIKQNKHFVVASDAALQWALKYPIQ